MKQRKGDFNPLLRYSRAWTRHIGGLILARHCVVLSEP